MALQPLGHRILIQPDEPATATDTGIVLPNDRDHVPVSGIVVAVGDGPERDQRIRLATIARCMAIVEEVQMEHCDGQGCQIAATELRRYKNQIERYESLKVGDRVVYPVESGLALKEDGKEYILLNEDDAVVIATADDAAEAMDATAIQSTDLERTNQWMRA